MSDIIIIEFISNQKRGLQVTNYIVKWDGSVCYAIHRTAVVCHMLRDI